MVSPLSAPVSSRLARALWIEILNLWRKVSKHLSRLARALWIEIKAGIVMPDGTTSRGSREPCGLKSYTGIILFIQRRSRLARALWIEIVLNEDLMLCRYVEARESLVD